MIAELGISESLVKFGDIWVSVRYLGLQLFCNPCFGDEGVLFWRPQNQKSYAHCRVLAFCGGLENLNRVPLKATMIRLYIWYLNN